MLRPYGGIEMNVLLLLLLCRKHVSLSELLKLIKRFKRVKFCGCTASRTNIKNPAQSNLDIVL